MHCENNHEWNAYSLSICSCAIVHPVNFISSFTDVLAFAQIVYVSHALAQLSFWFGNYITYFWMILQQKIYRLHFLNCEVTRKLLKLWFQLNYNQNQSLNQLQSITQSRNIVNFTNVYFLLILMPIGSKELHYHQHLCIFRLHGIILLLLSSILHNTLICLVY